MSDVMELVRDKKKVAEPTISFFKLLYEQKSIEILERKLKLQSDILDKAVNRQLFYTKLYKEYLEIK